MKVSAILLARALAFVELYDLAPHGNVFSPDLVQGLVEEYQFQKFPTTFADLDQSKGIEFYEGKLDGTVINKLTLYDKLLAIETRSNTEESRLAIEKILNWGRDRFRLVDGVKLIRHYAYVSQITFTTEVPILSTAPLDSLADRTAEAVSRIWNEPISYQPVAVAVGHDPMARKTAIAALTIHRRAETPLKENKYFSEAPLPTDTHVDLLTRFEDDISLARSTR